MKRDALPVAPIRYLSLFSGIEAATVAWAPLGWVCVGVAEIEKFPSIVLAHHYPDVPNLGDITKITEADIAALGHIDVMVFGSPCFTAGHTVLTTRGLVPIESVVVGDSVWTHASRWRAVTAVMTRTAPTVVLRGQGHNAMRATPDHPFFAAATERTHSGHGYTRSVGAPAWTPAAEMKGMRWATPSAITCDDPVPEALRTTEAAYLAGLYVGDGHIGRTTGRDKKSVILSVGEAKRDSILPRLQSAWGTVSCLKHGPTVWRLQLSRTHLADAIGPEFGGAAHEKTVPTWAFGASKEWQAAFLQGIIDTDGSVIANGYRVTTVSRSLAVGVRLLACQLGYMTAMSFVERPPTHVIQGRTVNQRDTWTVIFRKNCRSSELRTESHAWGLVRSVTPAEDAIVYDITVDEDHSFICDGLVVHNCQDMSVAGKRKGMLNADGTVTRSGLFFAAFNIFQWARKHCGARFALWENVPGAYSSSQGRDFASVVELLAGLDDVAVPVNGWGTEGCALGDNGLLEWACLDAQWFGVAQRRRRVFAVLDTGDWSSRAPILLERQSLRGDTAPRRETGQSAAGTLSSRTTGGGGLGTDFECTGGLQPVVLPGARAGGAELGIDRSPTLTCNHEAPIVAGMAAAVDVCPILRAGGNQTGGDRPPGTDVDTADSLLFGLAIAFDARQDCVSSTEVFGSLGSSSPQAQAIAFDTYNQTVTGDVTQTLCSRGDSPGGVSHLIPAIAFSCKDHGADATIELAPTMRAMGHAASHANAGGQLAVAFAQNSRDEVRLMNGDGQIVGALSAEPGMKQTCYVATCVTGDVTHCLKVEGFDASEDGAGRGQPIVAAFAFDATGSTIDAGDVFPTLRKREGGASGHGAAVASGMAVRRLTPTETERLQGFPDGHTAIPIKKYARKRVTKLRPESMWAQIDGNWWLLAADGPRYKSHGNSFAVPVINWIGRKIQSAMEAS